MKHRYFLYRIQSAYLFPVMLLCIVFSGCKKDDPAPVDAGYNYFPDNVGHWCIYEVDSTVYRDFFGDTLYFRYQVKEVIESEFTDNEGRRALRVERYKRPYVDTVPYESLPWTISRVLTFVRTASHAEKVEENMRYIRLVFVPRDGDEWNGNAYNTGGIWEYRYETVDKPYMLGQVTYDSTLTVIQKADSNYIWRKQYTEVYARNIGMIEKTVIDVSSDPDSLIPNYDVLSRIDTGKIYRIRLIAWGN